MGEGAREAGGEGVSEGGIIIGRDMNECVDEKGKHVQVVSGRERNALLKNKGGSVIIPFKACPARAKVKPT